MSAHLNYTGSPPVPTNREAISAAELRALPPLLDLMTAARVLGVGRTTAYELARSGQWPSPLLRIGRRFKVPTGPLLALLELPFDRATDPAPSVPRWHESDGLVGDAG